MTLNLTGKRIKEFKEVLVGNDTEPYGVTIEFDDNTVLDVNGNYGEGVNIDYIVDQSPDTQLVEPECYLNVNTGDLYIINWKRNRLNPADGWVRISRKVWEQFSKLR
jgi:hypothetical protein